MTEHILTQKRKTQQKEAVIKTHPLEREKRKLLKLY